MRTLLSLMYFLTLFFVAPPLKAQEGKQSFEGLLNKLLAPGPLIVGHENLEHKDCLKCHEPAGGIPNKLCADCHKEIKVHLDKNDHFHGLMNDKPCIECHSDHKGRAFDALNVNTKTFDHKQTGFELDGAHSKVECAKCHTDTRKGKPIRQNETRYFGTADSCIKCHTKDDIHFFENKFKGKECSSCHSTESWKAAIHFDHRKETGYELIGAHAKQSCNKCHVSEGKNDIKYTWPQLKSQKCLSCHKDQHGDNLSPRFRGGNCASCHGQESWKISDFDHSVTSFNLRGKHAQVQCVDCHKQSPQLVSKGGGFFRWQGLSKSCNSCHSDYHGYGRERADKLNGPLQSCETCHTDLGWKFELRFDHNSQADFPITGKHRENACFDCHKPQVKVGGTPPANTLRRYEFPDLEKKTCETCHKSGHNQAFHKKFKGVTCAQCHTTEGWKLGTMQTQMTTDRAFHDKTRFPLTGQHKVQACKNCHMRDGKETFKFPNADKDFCITCHATVHKKQFSEKTLDQPCSKCHSTTNFTRRLPFDHDMTAFKITGKHQKFENQCVKCHVPTKEKLPTKPPKVMHLYDFDEKKDANFCSQCHVSVHKEQFNPETQKRSCGDCHNTASFQKLPDFNHDRTRFKLTGAHQEIGKQCKECHKPSDITLPTKPPRKGNTYMFEGQSRGFCEECHVNEHKDMFKKEFSARPCSSCHTTETFQKRKEFDHSETEFEIKGKHKEVSCKECHKPTPARYKAEPQNRKGNYAFPEYKTKNCATCHRDVHNGSNGSNCKKCHNENGWKATGEFHKDFLLEGVHLQLDCKECHVNDRILHGSSQECSVCHMKEDPHHGQLFPCQECHTQNFWSQTRFDHNLSRFPLRGAHRITDCRACHNTGVYQGQPTECRSCHFQDAAGVTSPDHSQPRYFQCEQCHNEFNFSGATGS